MVGILRFRSQGRLFESGLKCFLFISTVVLSHSPFIPCFFSRVPRAY